MTEVTHEQAKKLAGLYCGGFSTEYSFTHVGLMLMLNHCLELATPAPAQPEGFAEAEARAKRVEDVAAKYAARTEYGEVIFPGQSWMMFVADLATEAGAAASAQPEPKGTTPSEKAPGTGTTPEALGTGAQEGAQEGEPTTAAENEAYMAGFADGVAASASSTSSGVSLELSEQAPGLSQAAAPVEGAASDWIRVEDRLPDPWTEVLVHPRPTDACCEAQVDRLGVWTYTAHDQWGCNPRKCVVTHWFAPPAAPKEQP